MVIPSTGEILLSNLSGKVENDVGVATLAIAFVEAMLDFLSDSEQQIAVITWAFHGEGLRNGPGDIKPLFLGKREPEDFLAKRNFGIGIHR
jgi:hypothetical protein